MTFEDNYLKELYISKYGETLNWENLNEFIKKVCEEQSENIISRYRKHSTSLCNKDDMNRNYLSEEDGQKYCSLDPDDMDYF